MRFSHVAMLTAVLVLVVVGLHKATQLSSPHSSTSGYYNTQTLEQGVRNVVQGNMLRDPNAAPDLTITDVHCNQSPLNRAQFFCVAYFSDGQTLSSYVTITAQGNNFISTPTGS